MKFVTQADLGNLVVYELGNALDVRLAVAYFNPSDDVFAALCKVPRLTCLISEEFTVNNPYKLEKLPGTATVRSIPTSCENGKLHAKVLIVDRRNGGTWVLIGSANMTWQGLFSNQEACIVLESQDDADRSTVRAIVAWFDSVLKQHGRPPNLEAAKQIFDSRSLYRLEPRPQTAEAAPRYLALKTTAGDTGEDHWPSFLRERVIAIGWAQITVDPANASEVDLQNAIRRDRPDSMDPNGAAKTIKNFVGLRKNDIVLIIRGYVPNQKKPVHVYGFARVIGPFRDEQSGNWKWRFKHDAVIQVVDLYLPKDVVASALDKGSLRGTIHELDRSRFERLVEKLGVPLEV